MDGKGFSDEATRIEILKGFPDEAARFKILSAVTRQLKAKDAFDLAKIARSTPGFVEADLKALCSKAAMIALRRSVEKRQVEYGDDDRDWLAKPWSDEEMENLYVTTTDFEEATKVVCPSLLKKGLLTIPNIKWDDVGGRDSVRQVFYRHLIGPIESPILYEKYGVNGDTGFLLTGPPGCEKMLIAKAVASEAGANFIHIKGPDLLIDHSESVLISIFSLARACSPCIVFIDEVDVLTTDRGKGTGLFARKLYDQLRSELDDAEQGRGVYVIGATDRIEDMDSEMLVPGRFWMRVEVPLPSPDERGMILKALCQGKPMDGDVDLVALGKDKRLYNFSDAGLTHLVSEAACAALDDILPPSDANSNVPRTIKLENIERALKKVSPSV